MPFWRKTITKIGGQVQWKNGRLSHGEGVDIFFVVSRQDDYKREGRRSGQPCRRGIKWLICARIKCRSRSQSDFKFSALAYSPIIYIRKRYRAFLVSRAPDTSRNRFTAGGEFCACKWIVWDRTSRSRKNFCMGNTGVYFLSRPAANPYIKKENNF